MSDRECAIGVDSGMLGFVDVTNVDAFMEETEQWWDGTLPLPDAGGVVTGGGIMADTGGDDVFPAVYDADNSGVRELLITLDEPDDPDVLKDDATWSDLGRVHVPTRVLLVADPAAAEQFALDPFEGHVSAPGDWIVCRLASEWLDVQMQTAVVGGWERPVTLRGRVVVN